MAGFALAATKIVLSGGMGKMLAMATSNLRNILAPDYCAETGEDDGSTRRARPRHGRTYGRDVSGLPAWLIWAFVHLMYLVQFRSRITVFIEWAIEDLTFSRGARLITGRGATDLNKEIAPEGHRRGVA